MALTPQNLDKVMTELVAVSRSAVSKREEAANLARIWGRVGERGGPGSFAAELLSPVTVARALPPADDRSPMLPTPGPARRRARWRRVA